MKGNRLGIVLLVVFALLLGGAVLFRAAYHAQAEAFLIEWGARVAEHPELQNEESGSEVADLQFEIEGVYWFMFHPHGSGFGIDDDGAFLTLTYEDVLFGGGNRLYYSVAKDELTRGNH